MSDLAAELRSSDGELHPFAGVDPAIDLRTLLSMSYGVLTASAARLFRLLGLHPGAEFTVTLAASLAAVSAARVRPVLTELVQASLVTRVGGDRFALHDLIRAYAGELVRSTEPDAARAAAEHRMFDHYLGAALASARRLEPSREALPAWPLGAGVVISPVDGAASAATWFARELPTLLRVVDRAGVTGRDTHAWRLAWAVTTYLQRSGRWREQVSMQRAALTAARAAADQVGQSHAHRGLARAHLRLARYDLAEAEARSALELSRALDDPIGQARAQATLAAAFNGWGRHQVALWHSRRAFVLFRAAGRRGPAAESLNSIAWSYAQLGRYHPARGCARRAINQLRAAGDRHGEASAWDTLGYAHAHLGEQVAATRCYRRALRLFTVLGDEFLQAEVLMHLGDARAVVGELSGARAAWRRALSLLDRLGHPGAEALWRRLSSG
ncbi:hypothetical protein [Micromonospora rubida]